MPSRPANVSPHHRRCPGTSAAPTPAATPHRAQGLDVLLHVRTCFGRIGWPRVSIVGHELVDVPHAGPARPPPVLLPGGPHVQSDPRPVAIPTRAAPATSAAGGISWGAARSAAIARRAAPRRRAPP